MTITARAGQGERLNWHLSCKEKIEIEAPVMVTTPQFC